jgi:Patatin-like phospholipase
MSSACGSASKYFPRGEELLDAEWEHLKKFWEAGGNRGTDDPIDRGRLSGLALSGGGVRSASFAIGVLQALAEEKADALASRPSLLDRVHYMSTVSGGGYAGSSLTRFLHHDPDRDVVFDTSDNFPFKRSLERNAELNEVRNRASYLEPGAGLDKFVSIAVVGRTIFTSIFVYFLLLVAVLWLVYPILLQPLQLPWGLPNLNAATVITAAFGFWIALHALRYSLVTGTTQGRSIGFALRRKTETTLGPLWQYTALAGGLAVLGYLPESNFLDAIWGKSTAILATLAPLLGIAGALFSQVISQFGGKSDSRALPAIVIWASGLLLLASMAGFAIYAIRWLGSDWIGFYCANPFDVMAAAPLPDCRPYPLAPRAVILGAIAAVGLLFATVVNLNYVGLHRFYRDRLMETFLVTPDEREDEDLSKPDHLPLHECCAPGDLGPFQLINTNVVLVNSENPRFRGRGGDSFVLSPFTSGSGATGWMATAKWASPVKGRAMWGKDLPVGAVMEPISLATAMAVSGAALNPRTGADGKGPTRSGMLSFILALLNIRLGYWSINPQNVGPDELWKAANFIIPGLTEGILFRGHKEDGNWIELSDGVHFDNIGLYELFRRRVRTIIVVDGTADPEFSMASFSNAYERGHNDFGVTIEISRYPANFNDLMPGSARPNSPIKQRYQLAERGFAIGTITYPPLPSASDPQSTEGHIFYLNTILTEDLPADLYSYKAEHPDYPDEPTSDQFFDEQQFDAYCTLGYETAKKVVAYSRDYVELAGALGLEPSRSAKAWEMIEEPPYKTPEEIVAQEIGTVAGALRDFRNSWRKML